MECGVEAARPGGRRNRELSFNGYEKFWRLLHNSVNILNTAELYT